MKALSPAEHWCDCGAWAGRPCDGGGFTIPCVFGASLYFHAYNLAAVSRMLCLASVRRAFHLSEHAPMPPARWVRFPWPVRLRFPRFPIAMIRERGRRHA